MKEQREHKRTCVDMRMAFRGNGLGYEKGKVLNISRGGMLVETERPFICGEYILASIDAEEIGKVIWAQGRVRRSSDRVGGKDATMAVEFSRTDQKGIGALLSFRGITF